MKGLILIFLLVVPLINCTLKVLGPNNLIERFTNGTIEYTLANFGHIPYGKSLISTAFVANPITACSVIDPPANSSRIAIIERGNCSFVTKVKVAQTMGARLAIIVDNVNEDSEDITMKDDGFGFSVDIPAVFIKKSDGAALINQLRKTDGSDNSLTLSITFDVQKEANEKIKYIFWLSTSNRNSFKLVREFVNYYLKLKPHANFEPHYAIWTCSLCAMTNYTLDYNDQSLKDNCISKGRYCSPDADGERPGKGKDIVLEDLRQICIFNNYKDAWWIYMTRFDDECTEVQQYKDCSENMMRRSGIDVKIIESCVENSFVKVDGSFNQDLSDNLVLKKERESFLDKGVLFWPSINIGDMSYRGNLEADEILEAICATFSHSVDVCNGSVTVTEDGNKVNVAVIVFIVIGIVILFVLLVSFFYKRFVKKELSREMSTQVNEMVSQYISLYENRGKLNQTQE